MSSIISEDPEPAGQDVDAGTLLYIARKSGEGFPFVLAEYRRKTEAYVQGIAAAAKQADFAKILHLSHTMISHCSVVNCVPLMEIARRVQELSPRNDVRLIESILPELRTAVDILNSELDEIAARHNSAT